MSTELGDVWVGERYLVSLRRMKGEGVLEVSEESTNAEIYEVANKEE